MDGFRAGFSAKSRNWLQSTTFSENMPSANIVCGYFQQINKSFQWNGICEFKTVKNVILPSIIIWPFSTISSSTLIWICQNGFPCSRFPHLGAISKSTHISSLTKAIFITQNPLQLNCIGFWIVNVSKSSRGSRSSTPPSPPPPVPSPHTIWPHYPIYLRISKATAVYSTMSVSSIVRFATMSWPGIGQQQQQQHIQDTHTECGNMHLWCMVRHFMYSKFHFASYAINIDRGEGWSEGSSLHVSM